MASTKLCDTAVTIDWLEEKLKNVVQISEKCKECKLNSWKAKKIGVGQGFLSNIVKIDLDWSECCEIPSTVVIKVPTMESINKHMEAMIDETTFKNNESMSKEEMDRLMAEVFLPTAHRQECTFYDMMRDTEYPVPIPRTWYCQQIGTDHPGVIIMEDLSDKGKLVNICHGLNIAQVLSIADALASLHVYSIKHQGEWESKFPPMPKDSFKGWPEMMEGVGDKLTQMRPKYFEGKLKKVDYVCDPDYAFDCMKSHEEFKLPAVLVQGDMWTNNMMFRPGTDGKAGSELCAILDWQVTHPGNLAEDLARLLVSSCSSQLRRTYANMVLEYYFIKLQERMPEGKVPFTYQDVLAAYKRILPYAMCFFVFGLPLMCDSPIVEGNDKDANIEALLHRAMSIIDDVIAIGNV